MIRWSRVVLAALVVLALAAPASASAAGWMPGPEFGRDVIGGFGGLATDPAGGTTVVWLTSDTAGVPPVKVHSQRMTPDGTLGVDAVLGETVPGSIASVTALASGGALVAWIKPGAGGEDTIELTQIGSDGAPVATRDVTTVEGVQGMSLQVAADAAGNATVVWVSGTVADGYAVRARRLPAGGAPEGIVDVQAADDETVPSVVIGPDGGARIAWVGPQGGSVDAAWVARLNPAGALDGAPARLSAPDDAAQSIVLRASADGAAVVWVEKVNNSDSDVRVRGARLLATGALAGTPFTVAEGLTSLPSIAGAALANDGTLTVIWSSPQPSSAMFVSHVRRVSRDGTLGEVRDLAQNSSPLGIGDIALTAAAMPDDTVLALSLRVIMGTEPAFLIVVRRIAADGTLGDEQTLGQTLPIFFSFPVIDRFMSIGSDAVGNATIGWFTGELSGGMEKLRYVTSRYDGTPPKVDASIPASVQIGADAIFSVTASDSSGIGSVAWDFGDGSGAPGAPGGTVRHVYGRLGNYPIKVTVTDKAGNAATVSRTLAVVAPPKPVTKASAALKVKSAVRKGSVLTVAGTLDRRTSGKVSVAYAQKIGRKTTTLRATAKIVRGRFTAKLRIRGVLLRVNGGRATLTVRYTGDGDTKAASVKRTLKVPKRAAKKAKKAVAKH